MTVAAVVPAAGRGERLGAGAPKALVPIAGRAMVARAVDGLRASGVVDVVVVVAPPGCEADMAGALGDRHRDAVVVTGGADRVASVSAALDALPADLDAVLVHDAARCLCPPTVIAAVVDAVVRGYDAVVPAVAVADTLKRADPDGRVVATVDRSGLVAVQTPQGFRPDVLRAAHRQATHRATDDAGLVEAAGGTVTTVPGDPRAFKITTPLDLAMAEALVIAGPA